jgi:ubiquinol-cytochrome c reductase cytochrome b subunit
MIEHFQHPAAMRPGSPMPPIQLCGAQLNSLAAFLLRLNPRNASALENAPDFAAKGAAVYQASHCDMCHKVNGAGMLAGPPLNGLSKRRSRGWVALHFADPQKLAPGSVMPPYKLPSQDLENLTSYLFSLPDQ